MTLLASCRFGYGPAESLGDDDQAADAGEGVGDAAPVDSGAVDASRDGGCDPTAPLADNFESASANPRWEVTSALGGVAAPVNGRLRITLPDASEAFTSAGYTTRGGYDFTDARLSIEVPTMVDTATHTQVFFQLFDVLPGPQHIVAFEQQYGRLQMYVTYPGGLTETSIAYDPIEQRYWQLREASGVIYFDTSPDGATWTNRFMSNASFDTTHVRLQILVGTHQAEVSPGFAEFDNLGGSVPQGEACMP